MLGRPLPARSLINQLFHLRALDLPNANGVLLNRRTKLRFDFSVRPTQISREYSCRIELSKGGHDPEAYVLGPDLRELAEDRWLPHIYDHTAGITKLCLFYPSSNEWTIQSCLGDTMVPWTISWLRFYEIWLVTDNWEGGGEHPRAEVATPPRRRFGMAGRRT